MAPIFGAAECPACCRCCCRKDCPPDAWKRKFIGDYAALTTIEIFFRDNSFSSQRSCKNEIEIGLGRSSRRNISYRIVDF